MNIIAVESLKGGVGKTTIAMHLAAVAAKTRQAVIVLDGDEEISALQWQQHARSIGVQLPFSVVQADRNKVAAQARELVRQGHFIVIDNPPNNREMLNRTAHVADVVLVPVLPTGLDVDRLRTTLELLQDVEAAKGQLDYVVLLNRYDARKGIAREAREALGSVPTLDAVIRNLTAYERAFGTIPTELREFEGVWNELTPGSDKQPHTQKATNR